MPTCRYVCDVRENMCGKGCQRLKRSDIHMPISIIGMPISHPPQRFKMRPPKTITGQKKPVKKASII